MRKLLIAITLMVMLGTACCGTKCAYAASNKIISIRIDGAIDPAMARYVDRSLSIAESEDAVAYIISIDTPGGLDQSMRSIVKRILAAEVPVVVYVSPQGARAASAGAIITLAANIAAMAPSTSIGAAHPVGIGGSEPDETMMKKLENDAASYAKDLAQKRGRNVQWAEAVVRQSISSTSTEAVEKNVIDLIANDFQDLIKKIDGYRVETAAGEVVIHTKDATVEEIPLTISESFLHGIADPNLAYLFMMLAIYGIIFELSNPGSILPGVIGGISLIFALMSFAVLPINLAGILLIGLGIALFVIEMFTPGHGVLTVGGIISFLAGSLLMFDTPQTSVYHVSVILVLTFTALTAAFFLYAAGAGIRAQKSKIITGPKGMIGLTAIARTDLNPTGKVFVEGEIWNAEVEGEPVSKGEKVIVVGVEKLRLIVRKETNK